MHKRNEIHYIGCGSCSETDLDDDAAAAVDARAHWIRGCLGKNSSFLRKGACAEDCAVLQDTETMLE